jgi:hypothetical protein
MAQNSFAPRDAHYTMPHGRIQRSTGRANMRPFVNYLSEAPTKLRALKLWQATSAIGYVKQQVVSMNPCNGA